MLANGIDCLIKVNGVALKEHAVEAVTAAHKTCYIEAQDGASYTIEVDMSQYPTFGLYTYQMVAWADGTTISSLYSTRTELAWSRNRFNVLQARTSPDKGPKARQGAIETTDCLMRQMRFSRFNGNDINSGKVDNDDIKSFGTIEVQVALAMDMSENFKEEWVHYKYCPEILEDVPNPSMARSTLNTISVTTVKAEAEKPTDGNHSENPLEGQDPTHRTTFSKPSKQIWDLNWDLKGPLLATFVFKYLSRDRLMDMNVITEDDLHEAPRQLNSKKANKRAEVSQARKRSKPSQSDVVERANPQEQPRKRCRRVIDISGEISESLKLSQKRKGFDYSNIEVLDLTDS